MNSLKIESAQAVTIVSLIAVYLFVVLFAYLFGRMRPRFHPKTHIEFEREIRLHAVEVAQQGGLSPREQEIFLLVIEGKDRPSICKELVIANDTVKTHMRHIYAKLDIHSKAEALELVKRHMNTE